MIVLKSYVFNFVHFDKKKPKKRLSPISSPDLAFCGQICLLIFVQKCIFSVNLELCLRN